MVMSVMMVLVMPLAKAQARRVGSGVLIQHGGKTYLYPDRGGGWYDGRVDYDGYGCYARGDVHSSYPSGSLLSALFGVSTFNDEEYWKYQNRLVDIGEKELGQRSDTSNQLLSRADLRGKNQHKADNERLKKENAELKKQIDETRKEILDIRKTLQEFMRQTQK